MAGPKPSDCGAVASGERLGDTFVERTELGHQSPAAAPGCLFLSDGVCSSATTVSVVSSKPATEAPFYSAERTTRNGSTTPSGSFRPV
jgi:hypothetical protein